MNRRLTASVAVLLVAGVGLAPAQAAVKKKKPAPIKKSYTVTLYPDASLNAYAQTGKDPMCGFLPAPPAPAPRTFDKHPFTVPAAGTLVVKLSSPDPTPSNSPIHADWDLYLLDANGAEIDSSHEGTATEQTSDRFKRRTPVNILVCNVNGETKGTVSYTFTYA